jgi:hypothetical protein
MNMKERNSDEEDNDGFGVIDRRRLSSGASKFGWVAE